MTKEQFKTIEKHYQFINSVASTMTMTAPDPNVLNELADVYTKLGYRSGNMRCNECRIGMMLTLNRLYIENKDLFTNKIDDVKESETRGGDTRKTRKGTKK